MLSHARPCFQPRAAQDGFTCLTLAARHGKAEMFHTIVDSTAQVEWTLGSLRRTLYPLEHLDTVHGSDQGALEVLAQYEQFELLRSDIVQRLADIKWKTFAARRLRHKLYTALAYMAAFLACVIMQPQPFTVGFRC